MTYLGFKKAFDSVAHKGLMLSVSESAVEREPQGPEGACPDPQDRSEGRRQLGRAGPSGREGRCAGDADPSGSSCGLLPATLPATRGHASAVARAWYFFSRRE